MNPESTSERIAALVRRLVQQAGPDATNLHAEVLALVEKPLIEAVLDYAEGNQGRAAAILGVSRNTLAKLMRAHGVRGQRAKPGRWNFAATADALTHDYRAIP